MTDLDAYLEAHAQQFEEDLCQLLRIASVSADSRCAAAMRQAGQWVADQFRSLGLETELIETGGPPIVYAQSPEVPHCPTALVYGHYDVQPPDPLNQWLTPPFEPDRRDGNIHARGATDDKGQLLTHIKSAQAWIETRGRLPIQIKYVIEGEEEIGSRGLSELISSQPERLAADVVIISDTCQFARGVPAITYGLRGIACYELHLRGPSHDLHSGTFGGAVANPANALARMLAALIDDSGRVQIPGFYDKVRTLTAQERRQLASLPFDEKAFQDQVGVDRLSGEEGYSTLERRWTRPTFDIHGLSSGYQGEGAKTVLPAEATAKFSFRLVPDQDPARISKLVGQRLAALCPAGVQMELTDMHGTPAVVVPLDSPFVAAASGAIQRGFGRAPVLIREGGSIPVVTAFKQQLHVDTLLLGWGLDDDNAHSPNEKFSLADFHRGIKTSAYLWEELGETGSATC